MSRYSMLFVLLAASALLATGCQQGEGNSTANANTSASAGGQQGTGTIGQSIAEKPDLSTFAGALKAAGLDGVMTGSQPYTVFAPTNAAFKKLPAGAAEALLKPDQKGQLTSLLTGHIVPGTVTAQDLTRAIQKGGGKAQIATMDGGTVTAVQRGGVVTITDGAGGQSRVTPAGQVQSNGVVHAIDSVLRPGQDAGAPAAQ